jgi:YD repeat-containing protein
MPVTALARCFNTKLEERYHDEPIRYVYDRRGNRLEKVDITGKESIITIGRTN